MAALLRAFLVLLVALASVSAGAQQPKIGYVDMKKVLDSAPQVMHKREQLDAELRPRNEIIQADEARLRNLQNQLPTTTADESQRVLLEREIRDLERSVARRREDLVDELNFRLTQETAQLEDEIELVVQNIAEEGAYSLIVTGPFTIYANPAIDITEQVLQRLEREFNTDQANLQ